MILKLRLEELEEITQWLASKVYEEAAKAQKGQATTNDSTETEAKKDKKDDVQEAKYEEK
jgi:hypothetical protein